MRPSPMSLHDAPQRAVGAQSHILALAALVAPPLAVFAPLAMAPLLTIVAAALLVSDWRRSLAAASSFTTLGVLLALISLWGAATSLWSLIPGHSLFESTRLLAISAGGLVVIGVCTSISAPEAGRIRRAIVIGAAIAIALLQIERWNDAILSHLLRGIPMTEDVPLSYYDRGVTLLVLASWPTAAALAAWRGWKAVLLGAAMVLGTVFIFWSQAAALSTVVGLAVVPLAWRLPRVAAAVLLAGPLVLAFVLPLAALDGAHIERVHQSASLLKPSAIHRLVIWRFTADRIAERPLLGWGMDASRALPGGKAQVSDAMPEVNLPSEAETLPLHPHDAALQWRVELGVPGALLCIGTLAIILFGFARHRTMPVYCRAMGLGYAAACLTVAMLSFGSWQAWWLSTLWLTAALFSAVRER
jgi:O-antigen ligase